LISARQAALRHQVLRKLSVELYSAFTASVRYSLERGLFIYGCYVKTNSQKNAVFWDVMPRALIRTDVSEERSFYIIRVTRIVDLHDVTDGSLHSHRPESLKSCVALTGWALYQRLNVFPVRYELGFYFPEDGVLHSHRRENRKSYKFTKIMQEKISPKIPQNTSISIWR
jgi:hypothetical protein